MHIVRSSQAPESISGQCHWFVISGNSIVVPVGSTSEVAPWVLTPNEKLPFELSSSEYLGCEGENHYFVADLVAELPETSEYELVNLRSAYKLISFDEFRLAGYAMELVHWMRNFRFCGKCGTPTERLPQDRGKRCPSCGLISFPRICPAIIVAITKGDKILLAHNSNFPENQYSTLAGFVDPGESAEDAVRREVMEEVGITVKNIQYVTSQPWPFPDSLMLGYSAEYDSGEITPDLVEIIDGRWFSKEDLKEVIIPSKQAVARHLIEHVLGDIDRE